jgi:hypothetical protein
VVTTNHAQWVKAVSTGNNKEHGVSAVVLVVRVLLSRKGENKSLFLAASVVVHVKTQRTY